MEEMASPSLMERNHAVTLDPDSLKLRISLTSQAPSYNHEQVEEEEEENFTASEEGSVAIPWTETLYETLRLCRKRAYYKVQSKRRLHLPACLSVFLHREWISLHPEYKIKPRDLLDIYNTRFQGGSKRRKPYVKRTRKVLPAKESKSVQWTPSTLMHLSLIGQKVDKLLLENPQIDYTFKLHEEWLKYYPDSTLTGRNLKARLFLYNKTRPNYTSHSKKNDIWDKQATDLLVKIYKQLTLDEKSSSKLSDSLLHYWSQEYKGLQVFTSQSLKARIEELLEKEPDLFSDTCLQNGDLIAHEAQSASNSIEDSFRPSTIQPSWDHRIPLPPKNEWACNKHWVHIFEDGSYELDCTLTEDLVNIRNSLKNFYPNCDIFEKPYLKQPRKAGLVGAILNEWNKIHPSNSDSVRSLVSKLYKYDRIPEMNDFPSLENRSKYKSYQNGELKSHEFTESKVYEDFEWTDEMLSHLRETREYAEMRAEENVNRTPSLQAVTKIWKNRWKSIYPDLNFDWKDIVEKYNSQFSYSSSISTDEMSNVLKISRLKCETSVLPVGESGDSEVKGFRQWNATMKQGLINTKEEIMRSLYPKTVDLQSKQFATLLFNEFRKSFPKCMESTRSLLSKLQSIEKEGFVPLIKENPPLTVQSTNIKTSLSPDTIKNNSEENEENIMISPDFEGGTSASSLNEIIPQVVGFPNWSLAMIRDFIACMDVARRKYASLKDESLSTKQNQPRLIPLLLNEWKEIYPESSETDKTFLEKIKHLKVQKETIKKYLSQSGLLPRRETPNEEAKVEPQENNEEKFYWNKSMIEDVIKTRDSALKRLGEVQTKGKKVSFHHTWWEEFKKIYPNCSFGKNSLSAHYWKWKKGQTHIDKKNCHKSDQGFLNSRNNSQTKRVYTSWTKEDKEQLLDLAYKLQNNADHEYLKSKGFGAVLRDEWKLLRPDRDDHPSTLNLLYAKYLKEVKTDTGNIDTTNISKERGGKLLVPRWTPEHNRVLRQCLVEFEDRINSESYYSDVFQSWKKLFPNSSLSYKDVEERLTDLRENTVSKTSWNFTPEARKSLNVIFTRVFRQTLKRRRMRKDLIIVPEKKLELASNLHKAFIKKFPDCPLTPGSLLNEVDMFRSKFSANQIEDDESWTSVMINNMIETRKTALQIKKSAPNQELFNFSQVWFQEFVKLHPEYPFTKRNLVRKYKWHKNQTEQSGSVKKDNGLYNDRDSCSISDPVSIPSKHIKPDFLQHIKSLLQECQTTLPPKLPPSNQLFNSENDDSSDLKNQDSNLEDNKTQECFRFPGGAKLIPIRKKSVDIEDTCQTNNVGSNYAVLSILKIPSTVEKRLQELDLSAKDFHDLLNYYTLAREEYTNYLKRGYLAFFPFSLQVMWFRHKKDSVSNYPKVNGRNLTGLIEMFLEEFYSCRSETYPPPEVITKVPCKFIITELTLKQVITCFAEAMSSSELECSKDVCAYESWKKLHPKIYFSFKELISLHRMLIFETNQDVEQLENLTLDCAISDIWFQFAKSEEVSFNCNKKEPKLCASEYDESNISIEQHKEWYFKTKFLPHSTTTSISKLRPHFKVKNIKLFWSNDRIQDLYCCYRKAAFRFKLQKQRKHYQNKLSFLNLIHLEWRKLHPELNLDGRILLGKYISHLRRQKKEKNSRENIKIQEWNIDVHNFLRFENRTIIEPESTFESKCQLPGNHTPDFDNNKDDMEERNRVTIEDVLRRIDEKGRRSVVWTSGVMRDLLKAREESRRKKKYIDKDSRLQKVDNLFLEEWKKVRPKLSHLSIWTLNAYVRKFDQFKNKIINSKQKKKEDFGMERNTAPVRYFPNTCIPVYDLALVRSLSEVSQEVKDLIVTRQRSMETKVIEKSNYTLDYLWPIEWKKIYGVDVPANHLKNKLWSVERFPANMERLRVALYRGHLTYETIYHPAVQNDSYMPILPRRYIFPEEQILRTPFRFNHQLSFHDSSFGRMSRKRNIQTVVSLCSELSNHKELSLEIPKVKFEKQVEAIQNEYGDSLCTERDCELYSVKLQPKRRKLNGPMPSGFGSLSYDNSGAFFCNECGKKFRNINNYKYHVDMH